MSAKILIIQPIAKEGIDLLRDLSFEVIEMKNYAPEILINEVADIDAILIRNAQLSREIIENASRLKVISRHGIGVENIDVEAATERGIFVTNTPMANSTAVAEHAIAMILACAKNLLKMDQATRKGNFGIRHECYSIELIGKTVSIIGLGNIGRKIASMAINGLSMKVIAYDPFVSIEDIESGIELCDNWDRVFQVADFVSVNLPLNENTNGVIGKRELEMMKSSAFLINCARAQIIQESELMESLRIGDIAGAAIDVYANDPPPKNHPFFTMENIMMTPHSAAHTAEAMINMAIHAAQGIIEVLQSRKPTWPVNQPVISR